LIAVTAVCWALAILFDKLAVARAAPSFHALVLNGGVAVGCLALLAGRGGVRGLGELSAVRRMRGTFFLALIVSVGALALQLFALPLIAVGTLETLKRGIGNLVALANGWLLLGEEVTPSKLLAVALMTVGVALVLR
jgi:multidrug transporter EmrE-like cation transporter